MTRVWVSITTDDGELLERFAVPAADAADQVAVAKALRETLERRFDVEGDE